MYIRLFTKLHLRCTGFHLPIAIRDQSDCAICHPAQVNTPRQAGTRSIYPGEMEG